VKINFSILSGIFYLCSIKNVGKKKTSGDKEHRFKTRTKPRIGKYVTIITDVLMCGWDSFLIQLKHGKARVLHYGRRVMHFASRVLHFFWE